MMELVKKNIHMNRQKGSAVSQITLDDDFIVPDTLDDVSQILLQNGELELESSGGQGEKILIKGKLLFHILYRKEEGGLQSLGGEIPFEETMNVPGLEDGDDTQVSWNLEDLNIGIINSRKLSVKAIVSLKIRADALYDAEAAVDLETDAEGVEILKRKIDVASAAVRRKDTHRVRDTIQISGNKPNIERILWQEMRLRGVSCRPLDGKIHLDGELMVFIIYNGEGEHIPVQCLEESIPFSGEVELPDAEEEMIPAVSIRLLHKGVEMKPDYDGEMRELEIDAVLELDIRLYREETVELLSDLYSTNCEISLDMSTACLERLLTKNICRSKVAEQIKIRKPERILQICHSGGTVKLDEAEIGENSLQIEGVLEVSLLYLTDDDTEPVTASVEMIPFHFAAEAPGINETSEYQLDLNLEQLTAVMLGGETVEVKAVIAADLLVLQPICEQVISGVKTEPLNMEKFQEMPGIVGYMAQPGDSLWKIAKKFHTTVDHIAELNELSETEIRPGEKLVLVKEISQ